MGRLASEDSFDGFFHSFRYEAFRLEVQPAYLVDVEADAFADFLRGEPRPGVEYDYYQPWLDQIRAVTAEGRRVARVRVLQDPPTDYQRFELYMARWAIDAGEVLGCISWREAKAAGLPLDRDWWLFDEARLAASRFDSDGRPLGSDVTDDPKIVERYRTWRDLAVRHSTPVTHRTSA